MSKSISKGFDTMVRFRDHLSIVKVARARAAEEGTTLAAVLRKLLRRWLLEGYHA